MVEHNRFSFPDEDFISSKEDTISGEQG